MCINLINFKPAFVQRYIAIEICFHGNFKGYLIFFKYQSNDCVLGSRFWTCGIALVTILNSMETLKEARKTIFGSLGYQIFF
ncbi:hypothetical protein L6452_42622 [Arctium lappa]|uniref:Uncharacterized protein n=1 Tax=Arctium lappa TaxID=4217 RepID=A0ACB8XIZ6_ARCLA|nr:hypothetical protein L6452_42622 [Arctium lappa]